MMQTGLFDCQQRFDQLDKAGDPLVQRKGCRHRPLSEREKWGNRTRSKIRSRVEHVFGVQTMMIGNMVIRAIGRIRVRAMIGMRNLVYNLNRYRLLAAVG